MKWVVPPTPLAPMPLRPPPAPPAVTRLERVTPRNRFLRTRWMPVRAVVSDRLRGHLARMAEAIRLRRAGAEDTQPGG